MALLLAACLVTVALVSLPLAEASRCRAVLAECEGDHCRGHTRLPSPDEYEPLYLRCEAWDHPE